GLFRHHAALGCARHPIRFLGGGDRLRAPDRGTRRIDGATAVAASRRPTAGAGAGHAWCFLHGGRSVPDGLGRRSDFGSDAPWTQWLHPFWRGGVFALPAPGGRPPPPPFPCGFGCAWTPPAFP